MRFQKITIFLSALLISQLYFPGAYSQDIVIDENVITWAGCGITKKSFMAEISQAFEAKYDIKVILEGGGAARGIRDTAKKKIMMGGSCRMTLPEHDSTELFVQLHPVAWDALSVIVHKDNPIYNITSEQIKAVYTGEITNWSQLGGKDLPIDLYVRRGKISGVGYAVRQYIFQNSAQNFSTRSELIVKSSGPLEKGIEKNIRGLGITGVSSARKRDVKIISIDNYSPTFENVRDGKYIYYRPLYLVTNSTPHGKIKQFVDFIQSEEGSQIMRDNGTVPYPDGLHLMKKAVIYGFGVK